MSISFIILLLITGVLGFVFYNPNLRYTAVIAFIALVTLVPSTDRIDVSYASFNYYFLFPLIIFPNLLYQIKKNSTTVWLLFSLLLLLLFHTMFYISDTSVNFISFFVKDVFAVFLVLTAFLLTNIPIKTNNIKLNKHLLIISLSGLILILILRFTSVLNIERVNSLGFFIAILMYYISSIDKIEKNKKTVFLLITSIFAIILIGNRTIILILLVLLLKEGFKFGVKGVLVMLLPVIIWQISPLLFKRDMSSLFDSSYVYSYLFENRFTPFYEKLDEFKTFSDFFFGKGIGSYFYIPWFEYEQFGHSNIYSPTVDNLFFTLFTKYGVFSILIFSILLMSFKPWLNRNKKLYVNILVLLFLYCFTNTLIYQHMFLPFVFTLYLFGKVPQKLYNKQKIKI